MSSEPKPTPHGIELEINPEWEVHPAQVKECLQTPAKPTLLDIRRPDEFEKAHIDGALFIPMHELQARLEKELTSLKDQPLVVFCHHGARSLRVAYFLRQQGFTNVHSMAGGIDAWSLIIDPAVPRYR
ncbi:MAG: rhodanese-like domain-containing protein [Phycisphaerae bacterium]